MNKHKFEVKSKVKQIKKSNKSFIVTQNQLPVKVEADLEPEIDGNVSQRTLRKKKKKKKKVQQDQMQTEVIQITNQRAEALQAAELEIVDLANENYTEVIPRQSIQPMEHQQAQSSENMGNQSGTIGENQKESGGHNN